MSDQSTPIGSLYVHVPFCAKKCEYCAFYSEASDGELINRYVEALVREMEWVAADLRPRTIYFGGGTPSLLNLGQWRRILEAMDKLHLTATEEWTVECNPATVSLDKAKLLRDYGVNRLSMGVQSLDEELLDRLGRVHTRQMAFKSFDTLRAAGFTNLNLDLMFAIPGQSLATWQKTLQEALALGSEHLSSYEVIYEDDTPLFFQLQAGKIEIDEDLACAMYEELVERAQSSGFYQYEVANFAKRRPGAGSALNPGHEAWQECYCCAHNVNYWRGGDFYGLGPSATAYVRGVRTRNWANTQKYCDLIEKGLPAVESSETLPPLARAGETAAFGLRMTDGWPLEEFKRVTGHDMQEHWGKEMHELIGQGWAALNERAFRLTRQGLRFADSAAQMFLQ